MQGGNSGDSNLPFHHHGPPALLSPESSPSSPDLPLLLRTASRTRPHKLLLGILGSVLVLYTLMRSPMPLDYSRSSSNSPRTLLAKDGTALTTFLDSRFPSKASSTARNPEPHIWLTLADAYWARTGVLALHTFTERLNTERKASGRSKDGRETRLVVLCLDEDCMQVAEEKGMYAYGGFIYSRPPKILRATWPKLASLIEVLQSRDVFFVDADVSFKYDPYPLLEPFMETHDLLAQENDSFDHFNTGWMWIKQSQAASDAWNEVLKMDLEQVSRDQLNFNKVLNTTLARQCTSNCSPYNPSRPLKSDFIAPNGMKVRVLESNRFYSNHFETDVPESEQHESVAFHMTCGDDAQTKVYLAKAQGFWGDVESYYDSTPHMVTIDRLSGTQEELTQLMRILAMAAHHTNRALLPPAHATFTDFQRLNDKGQINVPTRRIFSAFPVSHMEDALGIHVVEPAYVSHASQWLQGGSVLGLGAVREDEDWSYKSPAERTRSSLSLHDTADLDMRHVRSFADLLRLMTSHSFGYRTVIRLINHDWPTDPRGPPNWRDWPTERAVAGLKTCHNVELSPACERICRRDGPSHLPVEEPWLSYTTILEPDGPLELNV